MIRAFYSPNNISYEMHTAK